MELMIFFNKGVLMMNVNVVKLDPSGNITLSCSLLFLWMIGGNSMMLCFQQILTPNRQAAYQEAAAPSALK